MSNREASETVEGPYEARDGVVWKKPVETDHGDGKMSITIGFPVCLMHDVVGGDDEAKQQAAVAVANLMNAGHAVLSEQEGGHG